MNRFAGKFHHQLAIRTDPAVRARPGVGDFRSRKHSGQRWLTGLDPALHPEAGGAHRLGNVEDTAFRVPAFTEADADAKVPAWPSRARHDRIVFSPWRGGPPGGCVRHRPELLPCLFSIRSGEWDLTVAPHDEPRPSGRPPVSNLLLQRFGSVGKGLASRRVRHLGSIARLSVLAYCPSEAAISQKIGINRDHKRAIFDYLDSMGA